MGFFDDAWDFVTSAATAPFQAVAAPFVATYDVLRGENVVDSLVNAAKTEAGVALSMGGGNASAFFSTGTGQNLLNSGLADKLSFGTSVNYAGAVRTAEKLRYGDSVTHDDLLQSGRFLGTAALAGGAAAIGGAAVTGMSSTTALTTYGTAQAAYGAIQKGDWLGAIGSVGNSWIPSDIKDAYRDIRGYLPSDPTPPPVQGSPNTRIDNPWAWNGEPPATGPIGSIAGLPPLAIGLIGVAIAFAIYKGRGK